MHIRRSSALDPVPRTSPVSRPHRRDGAFSSVSRKHFGPPFRWARRRARSLWLLILKPRKPRPSPQWTSPNIREHPPSTLTSRSGVLTAPTHLLRVRAEVMQVLETAPIMQRRVPTRPLARARAGLPKARVDEKGQEIVYREMQGWLIIVCINFDAGTYIRWIRGSQIYRSQLITGLIPDAGACNNIYTTRQAIYRLQTTTKRRL